MINVFQKYSRRLSAVVALLWLTLHAVAQTLTIRPLPTQQQLPMSSVHTIMQDSEGYM